jgi:hypothetical protein
VAIEAQKSADGSLPLQIVLATMSDVRLEGSLTSGEIDIVATMVLLPEGGTNAVGSDSTPATDVPVRLGRVSAFVDPEIGME